MEFYNEYINFDVSTSPKQIGGMTATMTKNQCAGCPQGSTELHSLTVFLFLICCTVTKYSSLSPSLSLPDLRDLLLSLPTKILKKFIAIYLFVPRKLECSSWSTLYVTVTIFASAFVLQQLRRPYIGPIFGSGPFLYDQ